MDTIKQPESALTGALDHLLDRLRGGIFETRIYRAYGDGSWDESRLDDVVRSHNAYVNTGGALLLDLLIGAGGTAYNNANAYIGVGDSNTAVLAAQTDLQAASNKLRKAMDATFPSRSGQVMTWRSTFTTGEANFAWNEIALFNHASTGTMLARALIAAPFTKTSALSIVQSYTITVP